MIVAIQFHDGDAHKALELARLIADIEPSHRDDVILGLVCQPSTNTSEAARVVDYCLRKMPTELVVSNRLPQDGKGCADLWAATVEHFARNPSGHSFVCTFDGGDSVPLRRTWINDLAAEHAITVAAGKTITGFSQGSSFINANMMIELSVWRECEELRSRIARPLSHWIWEPQFYDILGPRVRLSPVIWSEYNSYGITARWLKGIAEHSAWSHGWKDDDLLDKARTLILG
jgi:hypothetical protein